jgi:uncharacterized SAM-binding protein YcdF (DUF218 family)
VSAPRLVAVLGYSKGNRHELHPVCAARLTRASAEARPGDVVLLSGCARGRRPVSEADLMARAWTGPPARLVVDRTARSTYGNAVAAAAAARAHALDDVVLVTSGWHGRRAQALLRAALGRAVTLAATDEPGGVATRLRELACWALVPFQATLAGRKG